MTIIGEIEKFLKKKKVEYEVTERTKMGDIPLNKKPMLVLLYYLEGTFHINWSCPLRYEEIMKETILDLTNKAKKKNGTE